MKTSNYIYFAFTKPQLNFVMRHFSLHKRNATGYLIYCDPNGKIEHTDLNMFAEVVFVNSGTGRLYSGNAQALTHFHEKLLSWQFDSGKLIYPSLLHPLLNAIYSDLQNDKRYLHIIYAEGISSYLSLKLPLKWKLRFSIYRWIAWLNGFSAGISITGHPHGLDMTNIAGLIAEYPGLLSSHGKPIEHLPTENYSSESSSSFAQEVMFVGQPHLDSRINLDKMYDRLATGLKTYFKLPLVYKPHHFELEVQVNAARKAGFQVFEDTTPFEDVVKARRPVAVVSFRSTALINAPRLLGKNADVYTFAPFLVCPPDESGSLAELRKVLLEFGVQSFPPESELAETELKIARKIGVVK